VETRQVAIRSYFGVGGELIGSAPFAEHFAVELGGGFVLPFARRRFVLSNPERQVGETPNIAGFGRVGLTYAF
jgi:hypothetical protein